MPRRRHRVVARAPEGIAAPDAAGREERATHEPVQLHRLIGVLRTAGHVPARRRAPATSELVQPNELQTDSSGRDTHAREGAHSSSWGSWLSVLSLATSAAIAANEARTPSWRGPTR